MSDGRRRWVASAHLEENGPSVHLALTLAQSVSFDRGDRRRAVALARAVIDHTDRYVTVTFTLSPAVERADAIDLLRTHLGQAASDLDSRNWGNYARIIRVISAAAQ
ncbi:MAG: hypothetical protein PHQ28_00550 [Mycobacterium sp.]|nr:hypothetical protein [Mycobacterium sp.]